MIFIGGDHSITYPLGLNFMKISKPLFNSIRCTRLHARDARTNAWRIFISSHKKGWKRKNICNWLRKIEPEEKEFLKKNKIKYFLWDEKIGNIKKHVKRMLKNKSIYLSVDLDVINPKFFPAVNYIEKGGLSFLKFKKILKLILKKSNVRAVDIVEYVPLKDVKGKSKKKIFKTIRLFYKSL